MSTPDWLEELWGEKERLARILIEMENDRDAALILRSINNGLEKILTSYKNAPRAESR